ncbi:MAG TPA: acyl carrier protein [Bacteroidia bacterium]|nr:acyl carrier protein [Bacteroidia bacterium]
MQVTIEQLNPIFSAAFGEEIRLSAETRKEDIPAWDSVNHLSLIVELEEKLNVSFTTEEIPAIKSVKDLMRILETR